MLTGDDLLALLCALAVNGLLVLTLWAMTRLDVRRAEREFEAGRRAYLARGRGRKSCGD